MANSGDPVAVGNLTWLEVPPFVQSTIGDCHCPGCDASWWENIRKMSRMVDDRFKMLPTAQGCLSCLGYHMGSQSVNHMGKSQWKYQTDHKYQWLFFTTSNQYLCLKDIINTKPTSKFGESSLVSLLLSREVSLAPAWRFAVKVDRKFQVGWTRNRSPHHGGGINGSTSRWLAAGSSCHQEIGLIYNQHSVQAKDGFKLWKVPRIIWHRPHFSPHIRLVGHVDGKWCEHD